MNNEIINNLIVKAKSVMTGEWVYGFYVNIVQDNEIHLIRDVQRNNHALVDHWEIDPETICMKIKGEFFTGDICKDKKGRLYVLKYLTNPISFIAQTNYFSCL